MCVTISLDTLLQTSTPPYNNEHKTNIVFYMFYELGNSKPTSQVSVASNVFRTSMCTFFQIKIELYQIMPGFSVTI